MPSEKREWKIANVKQKWYAGETISAVSGQGGDRSHDDSGGAGDLAPLQRGLLVRAVTQSTRFAAGQRARSNVPMR